MTNFAQYIKPKLFFIYYIMTTFTNSKGLVITHTNGFLETTLLQLNSSSNYYTTGEHEIIFVKTGSNKLLLLEHTYHIGRYIYIYIYISDLYNNWKYD